MAVNENSPFEDKILGYEASKTIREWERFPSLEAALVDYVWAIQGAFDERRQEYIVEFEKALSDGRSHDDIRMDAHFVGLATILRAYMATMLDLSSMINHFAEKNPLRDLDFKVPDDLA